MNQFGETSQLNITASYREGKTFLSGCSFTAPLKVMFPFPEEDGGICVMMLAASAGILAGDEQLISAEVEERAALTFTGQSYDKLHAMKEYENASRTVKLHVSKDGTLRYLPKAVIPFRDSSFRCRTFVSLEASARLCMGEILTCGRYGHGGERFAYREYASLTEVRRDKRLIYRENVRFLPETFPMQGIGMMEQYTHQLNMFLTGDGCSEQKEAGIRKLIMNETETEAAVTRTRDGDLAVRAFSMCAESLEELERKVASIR